REKSSGGFKEQVKPGLSLIQGPDLQLVRERLELCPGEEILEFWVRCRDTTHDLVATDSRQDNTVAICIQACRIPPANFSGPPAGFWSHRDVVSINFEIEWLLPTYIDVAAGSASLFFDFGEIRALVPIGLGIVVIRNCIEPWRSSRFAGKDGVCHADNG